MKKSLLSLLCVSQFLVSSPSYSAPTDEHAVYPIEAIRRFADSFETVRRHYVEDITDQELIDLAIEGMLDGLDPHSAFLDPDNFTELKEHTSGEFIGLGIEIDMEDGLVKVISPIDGSPAAKAGVKTGDLIVRLDEAPVRGMSLNEAIDKMRGEAGTTIVLTLLRDGTNKPIKLTIARDTIKTASVRSETLEHNIGYIRVASFESDTGEELVKHLDKLMLQDTTGLILDLRNNPGGALEAAVEVGDAFINEGLIVYTRGRDSEDRFEYAANTGDKLNGLPIVVLVNEGSASASEIVAGALQDHKRGIILGSRTFGKGSVQQVLPLSEGYGIKLTTSLYFTPNGRSIQAQGIIPDINTPLAEVKTLHYETITERSLPKHLALKEGETAVAEAKPETLKDNQLTEAMHILQAMHMMTN